jgi:Arc/MetJ-type ribon-helix-helix transcriptional regulator
MSIQIALRLPEAVVDYIDAQILAGRAKSRSEVVTRFVARDRRRERAAQDVERILADRAASATDDFDELDALVRAVSTTPLDID